MTTDPPTHAPDRAAAGEALRASTERCRALLDAVPLPAVVREWMLPFVALHYRPEPKKKVRRNDPFATDASRRERGPRG
jgi:hypothetical protein